MRAGGTGVAAEDLEAVRQEKTTCHLLFPGVSDRPSEGRREGGRECVSGHERATRLWHTTLSSQSSCFLTYIGESLGLWPTFNAPDWCIRAQSMGSRTP